MVRNMVFSWLLQTACTHLLGYSNETNQMIGSPNGEKKRVGVSVGYPNEEKTCPTGFHMPLHYPRYTTADYEKMEEWKVDTLLKEYGLTVKGTLDQKRGYAMGTFLWPDQV